MKNLVFALMGILFLSITATAAPSPLPDEEKTVLLAGHYDYASSYDLAEMLATNFDVIVVSANVDVKELNLSGMLSPEVFSLENPRSKYRCESTAAAFYTFDFGRQAYPDIQKIGEPLPAKINYPGYRQIKR